MYPLKVTVERYAHRENITLHQRLLAETNVTKDQVWHAELLRLLQLPDYGQAVKWAQMKAKAYKIPARFLEEQQPGLKAKKMSGRLSLARPFASPAKPISL